MVVQVVENTLLFVKIGNIFWTLVLCSRAAFSTVSAAPQLPVLIAAVAVGERVNLYFRVRQATVIRVSSAGAAAWSH